MFAQTWQKSLALAALTGFGLGLRLLNLTNPPLDFHAWRQLRSATIARAMYYEMAPGAADEGTRVKAVELARNFDVLEPRLLERLVAFTYASLGKELLWIARLWSIGFWVVGGLGIYALASRMTSPPAGLVSLGIFLLLPYGVIASRSFQPDPAMVAFMVLGILAVVLWMERLEWRWAILAGLLSGMAILVKVFAVFPIGFASVATLLSRRNGWKAVLTPQAWILLILSAGIPALYYLMEVGDLAGGYIQGWVLAFTRLIGQPMFYVRWGAQLDNVLGLPLLLAALGGVFLLPAGPRWTVLGMWAGYGAYGLTVPSLVITHDYYNLPVIPIAALSVAGLTQTVIAILDNRHRAWRVVAAAILALLGMVAFRQSLVRLFAQDFRPEVIGWEKMGRELPRNAKIIGLTHDYSARLAYYGWTAVRAWPYSVDMQMHDMGGGNSNLEDPVWRQTFLERAADQDYFLVTLFAELDAQPILKSILYENYPFREGDGYILFDLRRKNP